MEVKLTCDICDKVVAKFEGELQVWGDMSVYCGKCVNQRRKL